MQKSFHDRRNHMTVARHHAGKPHSPALRWLLLALFAATGTSMAQTPPANAQFQQAVRQQQVSDQLQKSQQQEQQRQNVANMARQPLTQDSAVRKQQEQADRAQQDRSNARDQDLVNQYGNASAQKPSQPTGPAAKKQGR